MSSFDSFIPKEFCVYYCTFNDVDISNKPKREFDWEQRHKDNARNAHMLSFFVSTIDEGTKAYKARISTAEKWATPNTYTNVTSVRVPNVPQKGFKFVDVARRYRTNNALLRMEHPLGYVFEISVENALEIIERCDVSKGVILDELYLDKSMHLMNNTFDKFKEFESTIEAHKEKQKLKANDICILGFNDLTTGSCVWNSITTTNEFVYLGSKHIIERNQQKSSKGHIFKDPNDKLFFCSDAQLKKSLVQILDKTENVYSSDSSVEFINEQIHKCNIFYAPFKYTISPEILCVSNKPMTSNALKYVITPYVEVPFVVRKVMKGPDGSLNLIVNTYCNGTVYLNAFDGTVESYNQSTHYSNRRNLKSYYLNDLLKTHTMHIVNFLPN